MYLALSGFPERIPASVFKASHPQAPLLPGAMVFCCVYLCASGL